MVICFVSIQAIEHQSKPLNNTPIYSTGQPNIIATDFFGAAQLIKEILHASESEQYDELFKDWKKIARITLLVGGIAAMVKLALSGTQRLIEKMPNWVIVLTYKGKRWLMHILGFPQALPTHQVLIWEHIFENIMCTLCEQSSATALMLRNMKLNDDDDSSADLYWGHYRSYVQSILLQIIDVLNSYKPYYQNNTLVRSFIAQNESCTVCFIIETIAATLLHINHVCQQIDNAEDIPKDYLKKVARNTLILFKKLRQIVAGETVHDSYSPFSSSTGLNSNNATSDTGLISF